MLEMANIHITKRNGIILSYRGHRYCRNRTTQEKIHWCCMVRCCLAPLQSTIFRYDKDVQVLSVGTHNHNATGYSKNDLKDSEMKLHMNLLFMILCMKRLTLSLMIVSIQLEIVVLPILKLLKSADVTRCMIMIKLIYIAMHSTNI